MEGRASTFKKLLADFQSRLSTADFVAIDTEFTGTDIAGDPNAFDGSAALRLDKICCTAQECTLIRIGLTVVGRQTADGSMPCMSYSLFAFPHVGRRKEDGPDVGVRDFFCSVSALRSNAKRRVDFNKWIREGITYMNRDEEVQFLKTQPRREENHLDDKVGLLHLWKALCAAQLPFVVHCPLDLLLLLCAFERRPLPRHDMAALAGLIRQCTPKVYDTAHLHSALGRGKRLGLARFFEDARAQYLENSSRGTTPQVEFSLQGETATRYSERPEELAHEAGMGSLVTAQLFAYLRALNTAQVERDANKLFLYQTAHLDLNSAALKGEVGTSMFDLSRVTLLVAALDPLDGLQATKQISAANHVYKWMDDKHVLVVLGASGGSAIRKAADLAAKVHGVVSWMAFEDWQALKADAKLDAIKETTALRINGKHVNGVNGCDLNQAPSEACCNGKHVNGKHVNGVNGCEGSCLEAWCLEARTTWVARAVAIGAAGLFVLLVSKGSSSRCHPRT